MKEAAKRFAPKKTDKNIIPITTETVIELCEMYKDSADLHIIRDFAGFPR